MAINKKQLVDLISSKQDQLSQRQSYLLKPSSNPCQILSKMEIELKSEVLVALLLGLENQELAEIQNLVSQ